MNKKDYEYFINLALSTGADFAEIFYEESSNKMIRLNDSKLDYIDSNNSKGLGIRITKGEESYYTSTNIMEKNNIERVINNILKNIPQKSRKKVSLNDLEDKTIKVKI